MSAPPRPFARPTLPREGKNELHDLQRRVNKTARPLPKREVTNSGFVNLFSCQCLVQIQYRQTEAGPCGMLDGVERLVTG